MDIVDESLGREVNVRRIYDGVFVRNSGRPGLPFAGGADEGHFCWLALQLNRDK
jgi:hypothetical protein